MALELSREDFALLKNVLERHLSNLRMEISNTDKYDWRKDMQADEERLKSMLARIEQAKPDEPGSDLHILVRGFVVVG